MEYFAYSLTALLVLTALVMNITAAKGYVTLMKDRERLGAMFTEQQSKIVAMAADLTEQKLAVERDKADLAKREADIEKFSASISEQRLTKCQAPWDLPDLTLTP